MTSQATPESKRRSLDCSMKDGAAFSVMTGFGEQYFSPLAVELGASNMEIGLLASVPQFIGSIVQLYTTKLAAHFRSRRRTITNFVLFQALTWIPLALTPVVGFMHSIPLLILLVTLYFSSGLFVAPVWSSLMGDLVDENIRGRFFGKRNMITGAVAFASLFTAGFILSMFPKENVLMGFGIIFSVAFLARLASWRYLKMMDDPPNIPDKTEEFSFIEYLRKLKHTNYGKFALYVGFMNFAVSVSGPFFTVYMLRDLDLPYMEYTILTASAALMSFLAMTYWGSICDRCGNKRVLGICGILVVIVPLLWLPTQNFIFLIFAQIVSGFAWAGFNLSSGNFMFDNVRPMKRTRVFSYHNVLVGTAIFFGAITGGLLAKTISTPWIFHSNLQVIFLISGLLRGIISLVFLQRIEEVRDVENMTTKDLFLKYSGTEPVVGLTYRTITGLHKKIRRR